MTYRGSLQGEFVNSRNHICSGPGQGCQDSASVRISSAYRRIARAVPFYPRSVTACLLADRLGITLSAAMAALSSKPVCDRYLICQDGKDYCRLKADLSNVGEQADDGQA